MFYLLERSIPEYDVVIWEDDKKDSRNVIPRLVVKGDPSKYMGWTFNKMCNFNNVFHKITEFASYDDALFYVTMRAL